MTERTYRNALRVIEDLAGWTAEGAHVAKETPEGLLFSSDGDDHAHWVLWCPEVFGDRIRISWEFSLRGEPGLAMLFFGATSTAGGGIFDDGLASRLGTYSQHHSSDIRTLHASYFRRRYPSERAFMWPTSAKLRVHTSWPRERIPCPPLKTVMGFTAWRSSRTARTSRCPSTICCCGVSTTTSPRGPRISSGHIGFRQMSPLKACYRNLEVRPCNNLSVVTGMLGFRVLPRGSHAA